VGTHRLKKYPQIPWAYDTLFIWSYCDGDVERAYETGVWPNGSGMGMDDFDRKNLHSKPNFNYWHRVEVTNLNVGDVAVAGTVNTISIPSSSTGASSGAVSVPAYTTKVLLEIKVSGRNLATFLYTNEDDMEFHILVDGVRIWWGHWAYLIPRMMDMHYLPVGGTEGVALTKYDTTYHRYAFLVTIPIEWQKSLKIEAYNPAAEAKTAVASINYLKLA